MTDCEKYIELMSRQIDKELDDDGSVELEAHLKRCDRCHAIYESMQDLVSDGVKLVETPAELSERVMAAIREEAEIRPISKKKKSIVPWISTVAAVFVVGVTTICFVANGSFGLAKKESVMNDKMGLMVSDSDATDFDANENYEYSNDYDVATENDIIPSNDAGTDNAYDPTENENIVVNDDPVEGEGNDVDPNEAIEDIPENSVVTYAMIVTVSDHFVPDLLADVDAEVVEGFESWLGYIVDANMVEEISAELLDAGVGFDIIASNDGKSEFALVLIKP